MVLAGDALEWHEPIDTCLAFGLRSAPKIFTAVVDALQWIFLQQGLRDLLHYLDDFLFVEPTGQSGQVLPKALATCTQWCQKNWKGPLPRQPFWELDTIQLTPCLPADKCAAALTGLGRQESVCEARAIIPLWHIATCVFRGMIWSLLLAENDRSLYICIRDASPPAA